MRALLLRRLPAGAFPAPGAFLLSCPIRMPSSSPSAPCIRHARCLSTTSAQRTATEDLTADPSVPPSHPAAPSLASPHSSAVASSFGSLADSAHPLHPILLTCLASLGYHQPSHIQRRAFLPITQRQDAVLAAETGCGKTLAYLLPVLNNTLLQATSSSQPSPDSRSSPPALHRPASPRAVIVTINRELCAQVYSVMRSLLQPSSTLTAATNAASLPSCTVVTGTSLLAPETAVDVLITTPSCLDLHLEHFPAFLSSTSHLILDEADLYLSAPDPPAFLTHLRRARRRYLPTPAITFVAATIARVGDRSVDALIRSWFPAVHYLRSSLFHGRRKNVQIEWRQVNDVAERGAELLSILKAAAPSHSAGKRVLVFCNTVERAQRLLAWMLKQRVSPHVPLVPCCFSPIALPSLPPLHVASFHKLVPLANRLALIDALRQSSPSFRVLVCSSLAARGIDFSGIDLVVSYDCPLSTVEFLHRAGRTGRLRVGGKEGQEVGRVVTLYGPGDQLLVDALRDSETRGEEWSGFSRRRSLRRKSKQQAKRERSAHAQQPGEEAASSYDASLDVSSTHVQNA